MSKHTGKSYDTIAKKYAAQADEKPINVYFERPAFLSMLPDLAGKHVLDVGCGTGWHSEYAIAHGATVTAFDYNEHFVSLTQQRVGAKARVLRWNSAEPLTFAQDNEFDLILCSLVLHYIKDWEPMFAEFHRILKDGGQLIFSTHHPMTDYLLFECDSYFETELLHDEWPEVGKVQFYRRPLSAMTQAILGAGFVMEQILEPQPLPALENIRPKFYAKLMQKPWRLMMRLRNSKTER